MGICSSGTSLPSKLRIALAADQAALSLYLGRQSTVASGYLGIDLRTKYVQYT